jgi:U6 snRNA-associated Sm-like protein LSm6
MADTQDSSATNGTAAAGTATGRDPSGFLNEILHRPVTVKLNSGVIYKGSSC